MEKAKRLTFDEIDIGDIVYFKIDTKFYYGVVALKYKKGEIVNHIEKPFKAFTDMIYAYGWYEDSLQAIKHSKIEGWTSPYLQYLSNLYMYEKFKPLELKIIESDPEYEKMFI